MTVNDASIRVLLVEDDPEDALILRGVLAEVSYPKFKVEHTDRVEKALLRGAEQRFDAILLDLMLPDSQGLETFARVHQRFPDTPIVMLSGLNDEAMAMSAVQAGAQDYLVKGQVSGNLVARSIRYAIERQRTSHYRALIAERERFDAAVRLMTDAIIVTDSDWCVTNANHAATLLLNLPEEEWRGMSLDDVLAGFMLSEPLSKLKSARERVTSLDISRPYTRPPLFLGARLTRQRDSGGNLLGAVLMARDETDERCDQRVRADFFEVMSQKLRTPLTVLSSYLHLARQLPSDVLQKQWPAIFKACDKELGRMNVAVSALLDFKSLGPGQMEAEVQQVDVKAVIAATAYETRRVHSQRPVEVAVEVAPDAARVDAGAEHLAFILEKLLNNSVKFSDKQPVRIVVKAERESPAWVRISVSDNGPGIPHEYFDRVLGGFVQLESGLANQTSGLGIGLLMARQVVEAYGGKISIQSRIGEGATVSFTLPYSEPAEAPIDV